jgi:glycerol dehydrogenase
VAYRLNVLMISCPSLASNNAPCSAVSVIYTPQGVMEGVEFFPRNPELVIVLSELSMLRPGMCKNMA